MNFITEEDIRARNVEAGGVLTLGADERLTPSATEYARQNRIQVQEQGVCAPAAVCVAAPSACCDAPKTESAPQPESAPTCTAASDASCHELTFLEQGVQVPKNHPAVIMRGKLDTLLAQIVLVQTQFDPKDRRPAFLKQCLDDLHAWVMVTLRGEMTGETVSPAGMGGMDVQTLHVISREPKKYLGVEHMAAHGSMGGNVGLLNWLRASVREVEVVAVSCSRNADVLASLNRLSSAVYVLMLLTFAAEQGIDLASVRKA